MYKLVRDNIPEILEEKKIPHKTKIIQNDTDYITALHKKLIEEVHEYIESSVQNNPDQEKEEIADILEVIEAICILKKHDTNKIQEYKKQKKEKKGGFEKRILFSKE